MKIENRPFSQLSKDDIPRPWLPVVVVNPHTNKKIRVLALIDTGADECALPSSYSSILGHNLTAGKIKKINTGNGETTAYSHTVKIVIDGSVVGNILIDFMPNLYVPLLGVKSFLNNFVLSIDYPKQVFSLIKP